jgi:ribosomal protein S4
MFGKVIKGRNFKKFKLYDQTKINIGKNPYIDKKLKSKKWYFLRFKNKLRFFPRIGKMNKMRFFYKNSLNLRRVLRTKNCHIKVSSLYKLYLKARKGNPRYLRFINLLESRLDVCLFRTGLFTSPISLRQFILHKNVYLNGNLITKPGILLRKDDLVQINFIHLNFDNYDKAVELDSGNFSHLEIDLKTCSFIYLGPFRSSDLLIQKYKDASFLNYIFKF